MGYFSLIQQAGFLGALPGVLGLIAIKNLFSVAPGGTVFAGDLFFRTVWTLIPSVVGWFILFGNQFQRGLTPLAEGVILAAQAIALLISIIMVFTLPIQPSTIPGVKIHRGRFLVPIIFVFLLTSYLAVQHWFILPKENAKLGDAIAPKDRFACETNPESMACTCINEPKGEACACHLDDKSKDCVCAKDPDSKACRCATNPELPECKEEAETEGEGFGNINGNINVNTFNGSTEIRQAENELTFMEDPAAATDPRLNVSFDQDFMPDSKYEDFFDEAVEINRQRKLVFGR